MTESEFDPEKDGYLMLEFFQIFIPCHEILQVVCISCFFLREREREKWDRRSGVTHKI
jgi:hypothetical protein